MSQRQLARDMQTEFQARVRTPSLQNQRTRTCCDLKKRDTDPTSLCSSMPNKPAARPPKRKKQTATSRNRSRLSVTPSSSPDKIRTNRIEMTDMMPRTCSSSRRARHNKPTKRPACSSPSRPSPSRWTRPPTWPSCQSRRSRPTTP